MELKIHRLLDSLLNQTMYDFIVIIIDDGSKDDSKAIIGAYKKKFEEKGIHLRYLYQDNQGAAAAINNGLQYVETPYFCLPDADDFYTHTYIEECVSYLENNSDVGIVFTRCKAYYQDDLKHPVYDLYRKDHFECSNKKIFEDFYWDRNVYYCPQYMIRTSSFLEYNKGREIAGGKYGQNYQMIMPLAYHSKFGYIDKSLYNYIIYSNSDSHGSKTLEQQFNHIDGGVILLTDVFERIGLNHDEFEHHIHMAKQKCLITKAFVSCVYNDRQHFELFYNEIEEELLPEKLKKLYLVRNYKPLFTAACFKLKLDNYLRLNRLVFKLRALLYRFKN